MGLFAHTLAGSRDARAPGRGTAMRSRNWSKDGRAAPASPSTAMSNALSKPSWRRSATHLLGETRIEIRDFGTFYDQAPRGAPGQNPRTGATVEVSPKVIPYFQNRQASARKAERRALKELQGAVCVRHGPRHLWTLLFLPKSDLYPLDKVGIRNARGYEGRRIATACD